MTTEPKITARMDELYEPLIKTDRQKKIGNWFKKPLKKIGEIYGVTFVTLKPFPQNAIDSYYLKQKEA